MYLSFAHIALTKIPYKVPLSICPMEALIMLTVREIHVLNANRNIYINTYLNCDLVFHKQVSLIYLINVTASCRNVPLCLLNKSTKAIHSIWCIIIGLPLFDKQANIITLKPNSGKCCIIIKKIRSARFWH